MKNEYTQLRTGIKLKDIAARLREEGMVRASAPALSAAERPEDTGVELTNAAIAVYERMAAERGIVLQAKKKPRRRCPVAITGYLSEAEGVRFTAAKAAMQHATTQDAVNWMVRHYIAYSAAVKEGAADSGESLTGGDTKDMLSVTDEGGFVK